MHKFVFWEASRRLPRFIVSKEGIEFDLSKVKGIFNSPHLDNIH